MEQLFKKQQGITLLEVLLVLAIASIIIVLSIRYYQSATTAQQANSVMEEIQAIAAGMDSLQASVGSYTGITTVQLTSVVGANNLLSPVGGLPIVVSNMAGATYTVTIPTNLAVCTIVKARLSSNTKFTNITACGTTVKYTYDASK